MDRAKGTPESPGEPGGPRAHTLGLSALSCEKLLDSLHEHVIYQDLDHRVIWANKAAIDSAGFPLDQIAGRPATRCGSASLSPTPGVRLRKRFKPVNPRLPK